MIDFSLINLYCCVAGFSLSTGPGSVDLAKKKPKNDIDICKVLMLVHLFPKYFEIIFLRSVCGSV